MNISMPGGFRSSDEFDENFDDDFDEDFDDTFEEDFEEDFCNADFNRDDDDEDLEDLEDIPIQFQPFIDDDEDEGAAEDLSPTDDASGIALTDEPVVPFISTNTEPGEEIPEDDEDLLEDDPEELFDDEDLLDDDGYGDEEDF